MEKRGSPADGCRTDQALLEQRCQGREIRVAHALGGLDRPAAGEDGESGQKRALGRLEELVAPVDRGAQCALAVGKIALAALEHSEAVLETSEQRRRGEDAHAWSRELERQR